jgi:AcrR family transcriptional regulator
MPARSSNYSQGANKYHGAVAKVDDVVSESDGRLARGQQTRRRVAESLVELLEAGVSEPTARKIAEQAQVSLRLVFHHFDDLDELYHAVCELQFERHWADLPSVSTKLELAERAGEFARIRSDLYEAIAPVRRAGMRMAERSSEIRATLSDSNRLMRNEVARTFEPELKLLEAHATDLLETLDLLCSFEAWDRLRRVQDCTVPRGRRVMTAGILGVLGDCAATVADKKGTAPR